jgi:hypothetical protein
MTSQNIDLSSWDTLYIIDALTLVLEKISDMSVFTLVLAQLMVA